MKVRQKLDPTFSVRLPPPPCVCHPLLPSPPPPPPPHPFFLYASPFFPPAQHHLISSASPHDPPRALALDVVPPPRPRRRLPSLLPDVVLESTATAAVARVVVASDMSHMDTADAGTHSRRRFRRPWPLPPSSRVDSRQCLDAATFA
jgi:hypothetical protein